MTKARTTTIKVEATAARLALFSARALLCWQLA
jgi:hypothetical protein